MLVVQQLSMRFGGKILFHNVSVQFNAGNRYGLVGANGAGKSTFIKLLTGEYMPEKGEIIFSSSFSLGTLNQDHYQYESYSLLEVVLQGRKKLWVALEKKNNLLKQEHLQAQECELLANLEKRIEEEGGYIAEAEAAKLLEGLGLRKEWHQRPLKLLSGGYKLRVLLAQVLFGKPALLVLDEPTNHLDFHSIQWLKEYLRCFAGTMIVSSHDRDFLNAICTHIADIDYGGIKIYKGDYEAFQEQKKFDREQKEHLLQKHNKKREDLQGFIDRFGAKASKARQAQSKARLVDQIEEEMSALNLLPSSRIYPKFQFSSLRASGVKALQVLDIHKAYGNKTVLKGVNFEIERGERVVIMGPNGIGKSTLLNILTAHQKADEGNFIWGFSVRLSYFPQDHQQEVARGISLLDWLGQSAPELPQERLRETLGKVLFTGETVHQMTDCLSGGETARLLLAKIMLQQPNVLILDEPTNHLDMEAIEELLSALHQFEGTLLCVSHNRYFVSRLANRILEISWQGVRDFKGSYADYLAAQQIDYLTPRSNLSHRETQETSAAKQAQMLSYQDAKHLKSQRAHLKKKVLSIEALCQELEEKIKQVTLLMGSSDFYQKTPHQEQLHLNAQKIAWETQLLEVLEEWEKISLERQKSEEACDV